MEKNSRKYSGGFLLKHLWNIKLNMRLTSIDDVISYYQICHITWRDNIIHDRAHIHTNAPHMDTHEQTKLYVKNNSIIGT